MRKADDLFQFRLASTEKALITAAAEQRGVPVSELVRRGALALAEATLLRDQRVAGGAE